MNKSLIYKLILSFQIQSIAFGSVALMGLLAHNCEMSMNGSRLTHFIYTVYFRGK